MLAKDCTMNIVKPEPMRIGLKCSYHIDEMNYENILMSFSPQLIMYICIMTLYSVHRCQPYCSEAGNKSPGSTVIQVILHLKMGWCSEKHDAG